MSAASRLELLLIEAGEAAKHDWQGGMDATWEACVASRATRRPGAFHTVYLWRVELLGEVFHKVGLTKNPASRFKSFCWSMIPTAKCSVEKRAVVCSAKAAEECERAFIVAARAFCIGGEWFCFDAAERAE